MQITQKIATVLAATLAVGAMSSLAGASPTKGTWSYTDTTPDESVVANSDATQHCHGKLPSSPADVNSHAFKAKRSGTLKLTSHNALDWAVEVRTSKGVVVGGTDGSNPNDPENLSVKLRKGSYQVVYCNAAGEPQINVDYSFK
jgi:hypothetical protein